MLRRLWDNCLKYEAYIQSHTAYDIFKLDGEVPKTIMSSRSADISQFCDLRWYEWVKFRSTTVTFHEYLLVLRKYCGLLINIGPAMTAKSLIPTGKVLHHNTYRLLMPEELAEPVEQDCMNTFLCIPG